MASIDFRKQENPHNIGLSDDSIFQRPFTAFPEQRFALPSSLNDSRKAAKCRMSQRFALMVAKLWALKKSDK